MNSIYILILVLIFQLGIVGCKKNSTSEDTPPQIIEAFPCEQGLSAGLYPCNRVGMFAHLTPEELGGYELNDIWGWKDQQTENLYAIVGLTDGISFVDITNPNKPIVVGNLDESRLSTKRINLNNFDNDLCKFGIGNTPRAKSMTKGSIWRDHKVFNDHLFVVSDAQDHGMQVFDLTRLREFDGEKLVFTEDAVYTEISNAHNIVINEETGFAYAVGATNIFGSNLANDCNDGGLHMIDINNPKSPTFAGCYRDSEPPRRQIDSPYIHDAQCVIYNGLDNEHINSEICFSAAERSVVITDVNDKANPITLGFSANPNVQYSHQGWLTEDHRFFIMNDELDEWNLGRTTKTHIFDVSDLDNPIFIDSFDHSTYAIDHNLYVKENQIFLTNYTAGLRILNFGDLSNMDLEETGFFDTQPSNNDVDFSGTWSSYPFFDNNMVIVSDISDGLFILKIS